MPLPTFLIIGAPRAGTTSLWRYCGGHPEIFMSPVKECCFFSHGDPAIRMGQPTRVVVRTLDEYRRMFDGVRGEKAIGEASPQYLASPAAPGRIGETLPHVRLVVSLREPVSRAFSDYLVHVREGRASRDPEAAFEERRAYVGSSFYFKNLERYFARFGRDRIKVLLFDDLAADPLGAMTGLFAFLGVDDSHRPGVTVRHNAGETPRLHWLHTRVILPLTSRELGRTLPCWARNVTRRLLYTPAPSCPPALRERLGRLYRTDILRVQDLIGRDLSAWLPENDGGAGPHRQGGAPPAGAPPRSAA